ncbi:hypothetical protein [Nonomuraea diastatica]|uniref:hypothetical protein n=1 Tax=Nonomuraea diastatica TaxID=1848329 RepID=UPI00104FF42F|nr:hypothetical protein [Nonomuraea diastatica]
MTDALRREVVSQGADALITGVWGALIVSMPRWRLAWMGYGRLVVPGLTVFAPLAVMVAVSLALTAGDQLAVVNGEFGFTGRPGAAWRSAVALSVSAGVAGVVWVVSAAIVVSASVLGERPVSPTRALGYCLRRLPALAVLWVVWLGGPVAIVALAAQVEPLWRAISAQLWISSLFTSAPATAVGRSGRVFLAWYSAERTDLLLTSCRESDCHTRPITKTDIDGLPVGHFRSKPEPGRLALALSPSDEPLIAWTSAGPDILHITTVHN